MSDDPVLSRAAFDPDGADRPGLVPDGTSAPGEWILSRWRVPRADAARTCAEFALTLTRLGAAADDRAHAVAALWTALRLRLPACVTFRLITEQDHRTGVLAVDEEILTTMQLPASSAAPSAGPAAAAGPADGPAPARAEPAVTLLDIIADQDIALAHHRRELESTDRGLLALHTELAGQAEQLTLAGERQRELLETEQAARAVAEAARARLAFLSHVGAVLGASLDHRQVVSRLSTLLVPRYAGTARVWLVNEQGGLERYGAPGPAGPDGPEVHAGLDAPDAPPEIVARVLGTRRPQQQPNVPGAPDQASVVAVPLTSLGTVLGVLSVTPPDRPFAHDDVIIVSEVAGRAAAALANALRFEQEREVAERLQHAMLTELPTGPGVECAARYLPAVTGLNVGGDWYDAYCRPDGTLVLAVGDVAGHGLAAATLMGQLRTAMRAYAMDLPEPGEVLTRLHALIRHIDPDHCATAILAMVSPEGRMSIATAGHPPPLLRDPDGTVRRLEDLGPMLGLPIDHTYTATSTTLRPGSMLLFYTDGLIERRDAIIDAGIDQLAAAFEIAPGTVEQIADTVCEVMLRDSSREDDTCLLVCQLTPERATSGGEPPVTRSGWLS
jgi:serine phosphatase RsbU (regulator of sigma subunit)